MKKSKKYIYLIVLILLMGLSACQGAESAPDVSTSFIVSATPIPTPDPTATPTPTPIKFEANIVNVPDEDVVEDMEIDRLEDTPFFVEITNTDDVVMVEFWSEDVAYCEETSENLVTLSENTGVKVVRVNVNENPTLANDYGLVALPSVYIFLGGIQVDAVLGAAPYDVYQAMVEEYR
ncbi:MAG: thioredoxin family protein [Eubacteriales bacterium]